MQFAKQIALGSSRLISNFIPIDLLTSITKQKLLLPFYHAIADNSTPHISNLYPVKKSKQFIDDLDFILKHFEPISFDELFHQNFKQKKPSFLLSFDDGLKEFNDVIAPILQKKGIPAMCFVNSAFINNKELFFRYKASLLIEHYKQHNALFENNDIYTILNSKIIKNSLLRINYLDREKLDIIAQLTNYSFEEFLKNHQPYLSSEQIIDLHKKGFHFGGHSIDHPLYNELTLEEQLRQTKECVDAINNITGSTFKTFSFPFTDYGVKQTYFDQHNCDVTFGCAGLKNDAAKNHFQRVPLEAKNFTAKQLLKAEYLYYMFKTPFGKNTIIR